MNLAAVLALCGTIGGIVSMIAGSATVSLPVSLRAVLVGVGGLLVAISHWHAASQAGGKAPPSAPTP